MPRGGKRQGNPGSTYSNRSDLNTDKKQPIRVAPSQQYGQGTQQAAAQAAMPLPNNTALPSPGGAPPAGPLPGEMGAFDRPTERPGEPLTTGLAMGAGAGPEVLSGNVSPDAEVGMALRAMYEQFPNQDLADLIEQFDAERMG